MSSRRLSGFTLLELLVVIAIIGVLLALLLPAVQNIRAAAVKLQCNSNLRQLALAIHQYHDTQRQLPPGIALPGSGDPYPYLAWHARLLPWLEQDALWRETQESYRTLRDPWQTPYHSPPRTLLRVVGCPADSRTSVTYVMSARRIPFGLTSYVGILGTDATQRDGLLFANSNLTFMHVPDGLSNTVLLGERPPSVDLLYGWWYAGIGFDDRGSGDMLLGVRERNIAGVSRQPRCPAGPYNFRPGSSPPSQCDLFHFWSLHHGGSHFAMADGSVHFLRYSADSVLPALATRAGGEVASLP
jgi:prepilin-type N-terminal cleavage/methylation domain-containing protein